jgi:LDH2 family malate/lactate/ureidoglycolate dehydrogenase
VTQTFSPASLAKFCNDVATAAGFTPQDAKILADCLIEAELRGVASHGLVHLPLHVEEIQRNLLKVNPDVKIVKDSGPVAVIDGDSGLGQRLAIEATDLAIERAARYGIASIGVRNSGSIGAAGIFALRAAERGMVGFILQNTVAHLAPPGAIDKIVGNNPFAFALPAGGANAPVVLDISCSSVARANLVMAAKNNDKIPLDWAIDSQGRPTDDPQQALLGALVPFAGHKGYGLAFVLGLLSGPLLGMEDRVFTDTMYFPRPKGFGLLVIVIDIAHFVEPDAYFAGIKEWLERLQSARLAPGSAGALRYPGERSHQLKQKYLEEGIALSAAVVTDMNALGLKFGCEFPAPISMRAPRPTPT